MQCFSFSVIWNNSYAERVRVKQSAGNHRNYLASRASQYSRATRCKSRESSCAGSAALE